MKAVINGWIELEPREGSTLPLLHLIDGMGKRKCRCRYGMGSSAATAKPHTRPAMEKELVRGENGYLYVGDTAVTLCEKSGKALREELQAWQRWEDQGRSSSGEEPPSTSKETQS